MISASVWIRNIFIKLQYDSSSASTRLCILPQRSKRIFLGAGSWSSWDLSTVHCESQISLPGITFFFVYNTGRSVPTSTYWLQCPTRKAWYRWSNMINTQSSPDDLNPTSLTLCPLPRMKDLEVYPMLRNAHSYLASIKIPKSPWGISFKKSSLQIPKICVS